MLPTIRTRPAMRRGDSILQTASIAARGSGKGLAVVRDLGPDPFLLLPQLGGERLPEVVRLVDLTDLELALARHRVGAALDPLDRLFLRLHVDEPEAGDR